uniref:Uncharacterized protein n=1 Tax=Arundo donax TaxID=35708 RepID=A0A0A9D0Y6_ARUDO
MHPHVCNRASTAAGLVDPDWSGGVCPRQRQLPPWLHAEIQGGVNDDATIFGVGVHVHRWQPHPHQLTLMAGDSGRGTCSPSFTGDGHQ